MTENRKVGYAVQTILCSEHWTLEIEDFMKKLQSLPMVCIGSHLEAALYGRVLMNTHLMRLQSKIDVIKGTIFLKSELVSFLQIKFHIESIFF